MITVMKFGGTSVGSPERMKEVARLVTKDNAPTFVVLSAMSGTTNSLVDICNKLYRKDISAANAIINALEEKYHQHVDNLLLDHLKRENAHEFVKDKFNLLRSFTKDMFTAYEEKVIIAQGEILSTTLFHYYLMEQNVTNAFLAALDFMRTDKNGEPDMAYISKELNSIMDANKGRRVYVTQGFICRNAYGEIDNLLRGGSDYSASIIGAALKADEIQIWTDIDGVHNNDPRVVEKTEAVRQLHFEEAAELAYFGAKILHPTCILPAKAAGIPVRLKYTMEPEAEGTLINNVVVNGKIKAVAAKDNITAINVVSSRMLMAPGFLRKVFEVFESYQTPIDMVVTSEVAVSATVDSTVHLNDIVEELSNYGTVTVDSDMTIVCVVGDLNWQNKGFEAIVADALKDIPVRMISYGGSNNNISFLIRSADKPVALQMLSNKLF